MRNEDVKSTYYLKVDEIVVYEHPFTTSKKL